MLCQRSLFLGMLAIAVGLSMTPAVFAAPATQPARPLIDPRLTGIQDFTWAVQTNLPITHQTIVKSQEKPPRPEPIPLPPAAIAGPVVFTGMLGALLFKKRRPRARVMR